MAIPGSNIRTLRRQIDMSIRDLAKVTGIDLGNLSKLEAGKVGYSREVIDKIAKALDVSAGVLFSDPGVVEAAALHMRQAPLLTTAQLMKWSGPDDLEAEDEQPFLYVSLDRASRYVFALKVEDDRNAPAILPDDELIFDANGNPATGMFVVAMDAEGTLHLGRLRELGKVRQDASFEIIPGDLNHCVSSRERHGLQLRGTLVELRRKM